MPACLLAVSGSIRVALPDWFSQCRRHGWEDEEQILVLPPETIKAPSAYWQRTAEALVISRTFATAAHQVEATSDREKDHGGQEHENLPGGTRQG